MVIKPQKPRKRLLKPCCRKTAAAKKLPLSNRWGWWRNLPSKRQWRTPRRQRLFKTFFCLQFYL